MEEMRWGIIGCGDVTEVKSGPALQKVGDSELVAVMRRRGDLAADFARRHGVPKWYDDGEALLADRVTGEVETVEVLALGVGRRFRGIDVLRLAVAEDAPPEGNGASHHVPNRKDQPIPEAIIEAAPALAGQHESSPVHLIR